MAEITPETFTALALLLESGWKITKLSGWSPDAEKMEIKIVCVRKEKKYDGWADAEWLNTVGFGALDD